MAILKASQWRGRLPAYVAYLQAVATAIDRIQEQPMGIGQLPTVLRSTRYE